MKSSRGKIIETASKLIDEHGITNFTLDAVAKRAKISKGGLLYHFPSKMALLTAIVETSHQLYLNEYDKLVSASQPKPGRVVKAYLDSILEAAKNDYVSASSVIRITSEHSELEKYYQDFSNRLKADIKTDGGDFYKQWLLVSAFDGLWISEAFSGKEISNRDWRKYLKELYRQIEGLRE